MGAPAPELVDHWLAKAFNAQDVEAAAAMYHPDASVVRVEQVHGSDNIARGGAAIREVMGGYIGLKPHMDVVVHHTTVAGDFALCRSQWLISGTGKDGEKVEVHHHGMEVMRKLPNGEWVFFIDHPWGADGVWAVDRPAAPGLSLTPARNSYRRGRSAARHATLRSLKASFGRHFGAQAHMHRRADVGTPAACRYALASPPVGSTIRPRT